ncbi:MAG: hypothetical protein ABID54_13950 [Pseudomonadota bacterium]
MAITFQNFFKGLSEAMPQLLQLMYLKSKDDRDYAFQEKQAEIDQDFKMRSLDLRTREVESIENHYRLLGDEKKLDLSQAKKRVLVEAEVNDIRIQMKETTDELSKLGDIANNPIKFREEKERLLNKYDSLRTRALVISGNPPDLLSVEKAKEMQEVAVFTSLGQWRGSFSDANWVKVMAIRGDSVGDCFKQSLALMDNPQRGSRESTVYLEDRFNRWVDYHKDIEAITVEGGQPLNKIAARNAFLEGNAIYTIRNEKSTPKNERIPMDRYGKPDREKIMKEPEKFFPLIDAYYPEYYDQFFETQGIINKGKFDKVTKIFYDNFYEEYPELAPRPKTSYEGPTFQDATRVEKPFGATGSF